MFRGLLPHLTWHTGHHVLAHDGYWLVEALPPALERGRLVYGYRLHGRGRASRPRRFHPGATGGGRLRRRGVVGDPARVGRPPRRVLLAREPAVAGRSAPRVRRPGRACGRAPPDRRITALAGFAFAVFVLVQPREAGDPVGPWLRLVAVLLLVDGASGSPGLPAAPTPPASFVSRSPSDCLRPERIAYHAHRDAEREARLGRS